MPKLGLTMQSGKVMNWLKREGDAVAPGEPLLEIESEKVSFTVEAPAGGVLRRILVDNDEEVPVSTLIGYIGSADEELPAGGGAAPRPAAAPTASAAPGAAAAPVARG